jgi:catechol 2,3-dioxygenase-like lactoylglutathione lyase family enzyme
MGMINRINISTLIVLDQDEALDFYVNKLGLEVANDIQQGPVRWLTVRVPGDPDHEIYLQKPGPPAMDEATADQVRELVSKGAIGWVALLTDDCKALYKTIAARGVKDFTQEPTEHFYGTDMGIRDPFGNHIRILQPAAAKQTVAADATAR